MLDMARKNILPAVMRYTRYLAETAMAKKTLSPSIGCALEESLVSKLSLRAACLDKKIEALDSLLLGAKEHTDLLDCAKYHHDSIFAAMQELRAGGRRTGGRGR